jgi:hypothetical protein
LTITHTCRLVTGSRAVIPPNGFPLEPTTVTLASGQSITADLVITATGQTPNTAFLSTLSPTSPSGILTPSGFVRVFPTLQLADGAYPHIFALGDVADSGAHKAARPGGAQAVVMAKNVVALLEGKQAEEKIVVSPPAIHMSLGLVSPAWFSTTLCTPNEYGTRADPCAPTVDQEHRVSQSGCGARGDRTLVQAEGRVSRRPYRRSITRLVWTLTTQRYREHEHRGCVGEARRQGQQAAGVPSLTASISGPALGTAFGRRSAATGHSALGWG